jgi:hypothetical protein
VRQRAHDGDVLHALSLPERIDDRCCGGALDGAAAAAAGTANRKARSRGRAIRRETMKVKNIGVGVGASPAGAVVRLHLA